MTFAEAFEQETGVGLHEGELAGVRMLLPNDERYGAFGIVVGPKPNVVFRVRSYGSTVHLVVWKADEKRLDKALRRLNLV